VKSQVIEQELSILTTEIKSIEEIAATLPDFCPDTSEYSLEV